MSLAMAPKASSPYARRPEPSGAVLRGRRGIPTTVLVRASRLSDLEMELRAAGQEMTAAGHRIRYALHNADDMAIEQTAARLIVRGEGYQR